MYFDLFFKAESMCSLLAIAFLDCGLEVFLVLVIYYKILMHDAFEVGILITRYVA